MYTKQCRWWIGGILCLSGLWASAQEYPSKPLRVIVPFPPGGSVDVIARAVQPALGRLLGQSVVIENKAGGGGVTGTNEAIRSAPDGYTLAATTLSTIAANPAINPRIPYTLSDYVPIVNMAATATLIAVHPSFPAKDYAGFIAELKRNPTKYSYASSGMGGVSHLQMEAFKSLAGVYITHIPYRGAGPALVDTAGGQVHIVMDAVPSASPFLRSGQLRTMVVASPTRLSVAPGAPTFGEVGLPQMNQRSYFGLIGPKGLPPEIVKKLNAAVNAALEDPAVRQRLEESGAAPVGGTPEQFGAAIKESYTQLKKVVDERKLTIGD
jgi:tripartite-type tricarboxylate transporter receptor subunit TctC